MPEDSKKIRIRRRGTPERIVEARDVVHAVQGARVDVRSLVDREWEKKSRDDVPPSDRPMPKNPLLHLKPHKTDDQGSSTDKSKNKD